MVDIKPKIRVEIDLVRSRDGKRYHVASEISLSPLERLLKPFHYCSELEKVGGIGKLLLEEVFALPGIAEIFIMPYQLHVVKSPAFDWDEIEPGIITALKRTFGPEADRVEVEVISSDGDQMEDQGKRIPERKTQE